MKVLLLNHEFPPIGGGGGNACQHIVRELQAMDVDVTVVTSAFHGLPSNEIIDGASVHRVPALRTRKAESSIASILAYTVSATLKISLLDRPDLVHAFFGVPAGLIACGLKKVWNIPYLVSFRGKDVHGGQAREMGGISGTLKAISSVWRNADALVANSKGLRDIAQKVDPTARVEVIPNGIDVARFRPGQRHLDAPPDCSTWAASNLTRASKRCSRRSPERKRPQRPSPSASWGMDLCALISSDGHVN